MSKLSSFSRASTLSPVNSRASRSPLPPIRASSSASSFSAASSHSHSIHMMRQYDAALSGSKIERESQRAPTPSYCNSYSDSRSYGSSSPERSPPTDQASHHVTSAALAAVASSRRSPTGSGNQRSRQPLPRVFGDDKERNPRLEGRVGPFSRRSLNCALILLTDFDRANNAASQCFSG